MRAEIGVGAEVVFSRIRVSYVGFWFGFGFGFGFEFGSGPGSGSGLDSGLGLGVGPFRLSFRASQAQVR